MKEIVSHRTRQKIALALWRFPTWLVRPLPQFLVLGAQKSGTTTIHDYLVQHPQFRKSLRKEIHFFDKSFQRGLSWYRAHFPILRGSQITGDISPYYLFHPYCPQRIAENLRSARFVVLLRNPVKRAISHYWKQYNNGLEKLDIEVAIGKEEERLWHAREAIAQGETMIPLEYQKFSYVSRGRYAEQLERYFRVMDRERFLVIQSESFWAEPTYWMNEVCNFLGLDSFPSEVRQVHRGATKVEYEVPERVIDKLSAYYYPYNQRLFELIGEEWDW